ncbi:secreted protein [Seiridium cupressi]
MHQLLRLVLPFFLTWGWPQPCRADEPTFRNSVDFNNGKFGTYPTHKFKTSTIEPPRPNFMKPFSNCDDGSYIFVSPRGIVAPSSFYMLDHEGGLIWGPDRRYGEVYNFQVQVYKGEPFMCFWAGDDSVGGHGEGRYYMLDQHYQERFTIGAGGNIRGDLHAFSITEQDTAVFTAYQIAQVDLSSVGKKKDSWIWDSLFQELDIESGRVLFEWRAFEHFPAEDSYDSPNEASKEDPWDYFHINMVEKDEEGNYLVSTRYGRCVLYVSKDTGEVLWQLGGKRNSFRDLSNGDATTFLGQHDAHWADGHAAITMFDNRADWTHKIENESVGHRIRVDLEKMTAEIEHSYRHPWGILSTSQGSMQTLPNGNVLIGYGFNGAFTEYTADGEVICDAYMLPQPRFGTGEVQSYRDLKFNWTGNPLTTPSLHSEEKDLYMSWLGSTRVQRWLLQDCDEPDGQFESVQTAPKAGFETVFSLGDGKRMRRYVRVIAVDGGGTQLSVSSPVDLADADIDQLWGAPVDSTADKDVPAEGQHTDVTYYRDDDVGDAQILFGFGILASVSVVLIAWTNTSEDTGPAKDGSGSSTDFCQAIRVHGKLGDRWVYK